MLTWITILMTCLWGTDQQGAGKGEMVNVSVDETFAIPGRESVITLRVRIKEGYHIQANKVNDASLIPVTLSIVQPRVFYTGEVIFPPYKLFKLEGTGTYLNIFDSCFNLRLPVRIPAAAKPGRYLIKVQLRYQACDAKTCLFPRTLALDIPVVVAPFANDRRKTTGPSTLPGQH